MTMPGPLLGAIEAGGTKFVLAAGQDPSGALVTHSVPTTTPEATLTAAAQWFAAQGQIRALGIASFGPVDLDPASPTWGHITATPKPSWSDCDIAGYFAQRFRVPIGFETDVNAAALAEFAQAAPGTSSLAYVTVGTGIGGGLVIDGKAVHGSAHPEMGHLFPRREAGDHGFAGICPFHGDCLEGLTSGPAIKARWGASLSELPADHEAHSIVAGYLAQLCHTLFAVSAVETVVLGGGVMQTPGLLDRIKQRAAEIDAGYLPGRSRQTIRGPALGTESGMRGAMMLAEAAAKARVNLRP